MRKTTKFDQSPWANKNTDANKTQPIGKKNPNIVSRSMRKTGGKRGA